jgi:hypothetical protein
LPTASTSRQAEGVHGPLSSKLLREALASRLFLDARAAKVDPGVDEHGVIVGHQRILPDLLCQDRHTRAADVSGPEPVHQAWSSSSIHTSTIRPSAATR